jgi:hypothetical protein
MARVWAGIYADDIAADPGGESRWSASDLADRKRRLGEGTDHRQVSQLRIEIPHAPGSSRVRSGRGSAQEVGQEAVHRVTVVQTT